MSLARAISRGARLKARLGVNGSQNDSRSLGTVAVATRAVDMGLSRVMPRLMPGIRVVTVQDVECRCPGQGRHGGKPLTCSPAPSLIPTLLMADKSHKSNRLKARLPRGLADRTPAEIAATRRMIEKIRAVYELYGFEPVETPAIEYTDALGKFLPDQDRPNEGVFSFQDDDEQWLSLRYDLTAPLARYVAENFDTLPKPYRSYRVGWVFRNEKPGPGRFRQFMQFDADTVGSSSPAADAELCMMAADTMEALGIPRGSYLVKVSNRKILDGLMAAIGLSDDRSAARRLIVLRAMDKFDRLGDVGVRQLLGAGRKDESGDFTKGAELDKASIETIMSVFEPVADTKEKLAQLDLRLRDAPIGQQG